MKILSWNVNGFRAACKKGLVQTLQDIKPDIAGIQELKAYREQCEDFSAASLDYREDWHSAERPGYSGVGLFWRGPESWKATSGMGLSEVDREGRVQILETEDLSLVNVYVPNGAASEERHFFKMEFLDQFLEWLRALDQKKPVVLFGDLNIAHREIDIHDPVRLDGTSGFKPEERDWVTKLLKAGFVDAFREKHPEARDEYSWWSYRAGARQRNKGWRIDYFVVSERIRNRIKRIEMAQQITGSDHCPLILEI
ncbi:MAG: exodeoxyribonuclease III [Bradymonadales bacterium]|nr:MAG: exodeoxyribonuclease III [Bradymonadales bacterium]